MKEKKTFAVLRLVMGSIFFWAGIDKIFGLGFATIPSNSWMAGVSPTTGFLLNATEGPVSPLFQYLAGNPVMDYLFVGGLVLVGTALLLGIGMTVAVYSGSLMMLLIYLSIFPPKNNPLIDEHIVYIVCLMVLLQVKAGYTWGLRSWWESQSLVRKLPQLS